MTRRELAAQMTISRHDSCLVPIVAFLSDCVAVLRSIRELTTIPVWTYKSNYFVGSVLLYRQPDERYTAWQVTQIEPNNGMANALLPFILHLNVVLHINNVTNTVELEKPKSKLLEDYKSDDNWDESEQEAISYKVANCSSLADIYGVAVAGPID